MTKIYVTKYALTKGIFEVDAELNQDGYAACNRIWGSHYTPKEYRLTKEEAVEDAKLRREKKIQQLHSQIQRLSNESLFAVSPGPIDGSDNEEEEK